jgi:hypothetical protein
MTLINADTAALKADFLSHIRVVLREHPIPTSRIYFEECAIFQIHLNRGLQEDFKDLAAALVKIHHG